MWKYDEQRDENMHPSKRVEDAIVPADDWLMPNLKTAQSKPRYIECRVRICDRRWSNPGRQNNNIESKSQHE